MKHTWSLRLQEDAFLGDDLHHFLQCWKKGNTALTGGGVGIPRWTVNGSAAMCFHRRSGPKESEPNFTVFPA